MCLRQTIYMCVLCTGTFPKRGSQNSAVPPLPALTAGCRDVRKEDPKVLHPGIYTCVFAMNWMALPI